MENAAALVGRAAGALLDLEARLEALARLEAGSAGCVLLEGPGGVGKSRLLAEAGRTGARLLGGTPTSATASSKGPSSCWFSSRATATWTQRIEVLPGAPCNRDTSSERLWPWRPVFAALLAKDRAFVSASAPTSKEASPSRPCFR